MTRTSVPLLSSLPARSTLAADPHHTEGCTDTHPHYPDLTDLLGRLHFSTEDGRIWLDDQRMLLVQAKALGALRREMIQNLGVDVARGLLTRMGFHAGTHDAQMARRLRGSMSPQDAFVVGPQLHCLEGIGFSELIELDFDLVHGRHYGEFLWTSPLEDEEHARYFPIGSEPACWMQIGYASGFSTEFMGQPVLYREVECQSMGHGACRIVGKSVAEWGADAAGELRFVMPELLSDQGALILPIADGERSPAAAAVLPPVEPYAEDGLVCASPAFRATLHLLTRAASSTVPVLMLGESGTGKARLAQHLHRLSTQGSGPFVPVHGAAATDVDLFGPPGQFGDTGLIHRAVGGTLFIDAIEALSPVAQARLVAWLQQAAQGAAQVAGQPARLVAASAHDLRAEVDAGRLRADLYYRLNVFPLRIAPLRERREDIAPLMAHFVDRYVRDTGGQATSRAFTQRAADALLSYDWPGNVRELENMVARALILAPHDEWLDLGHLFSGGERVSDARYRLDAHGNLVDLVTDYAPPTDDETEADRISRQVSALLTDGHDEEAEGIELDALESALLKRAVERAEGNVSAAARLLGITRAQMVYRLKARDITV